MDINFGTTIYATDKHGYIPTAQSSNSPPYRLCNILQIISVCPSYFNSQILTKNDSDKNLSSSLSDGVAVYIRLNINPSSRTQVVHYHSP